MPELVASGGTCLSFRRHGPASLSTGAGKGCPSGDCRPSLRDLLFSGGFPILTGMEGSIVGGHDTGEAAGRCMEHREVWGMLYLIRHGQTAKNKANLLQGRSDVPLNEEGIRQAERAGEYLRQRGVRFGRVYSSPLIRSIETARAIAGEDICLDERLIEMDYGPYEGMDLTEPPPEVMAFFRDFVHVPAPAGMEQLDQVVARLGEFLEEKKGEAAGEDILISTHAIALKGALEYLTPASRGGYWSRYIGNCDIFLAELDERGGYRAPVRIYPEQG